MVFKKLAKKRQGLAQQKKNCKEMLKAVYNTPKRITILNDCNNLRVFSQVLIVVEGMTCSRMMFSVHFSMQQP